MPLLFALVIGKVLFNIPKPFIEVASTEGVYVREANALPFSDIRYWHTETPQEKVCFGNNQPTRIRLLPDDNLKIGIHSPGVETIQQRDDRDVTSLKQPNKKGV